MKKLPRLTVAAFALLSLNAVSETSAKAGTIVGNTADATVQNSANTNNPNPLIILGSTSDPTLFTSSSAYYTKDAVFVFQLPTLAAGATFTSASLTVDATSSSSAYGGPPNGEAFNLNGVRVDPSPTVLVSDKGSFTLLQAGFIGQGTTPTGAISTSTAGDAALLSFLNTSYAGGTNAGDYVFINVDAASPFKGQEVDFASADNPNASLQPFLSFTSSTEAVPEPSSFALIGLGVGALALLKRLRRSAI